MKQKMWMAGMILEGVVIVGLVVMLLVTFGTNWVVKKQDGKKVVVVSSVCDAEVKKWNDIVGLYGMGGNETAERLNDVTAEIIKKPNYKTDPNCVFMATMHSAMKGEGYEASELNDVYKSLNDDGYYADGSLNGVRNASQMSGIISSIGM